MIERLKKQLKQLKKYDGKLSFKQLENIKANLDRYKSIFAIYGDNKAQKSVIDEMYIVVNNQMFMKS